MKRYAAIAVALSALSLVSSAVGQACYTPVTSWRGSYDWNGSGGGEDQYGEYNWTVSHQATGAPNLVLTGASCSMAVWGGPDISATGTVNDVGTSTCGDGSPDTESYSGGPTFLTEGVLTFNFSSGTFQYFEDPIITARETSNTCGTINTSSLPYQIAPFDPSCGGELAPPNISLPHAIQPLTGETPVSGVAACPYAIPASWVLTYNLIPIIKDDNDCKQSGGSTVGCRNQSLGEDFPIVGTDFSLHYESSRQVAGGADQVSSTDAMMIGGWTLSVHHAYNPANNTLYLGDGSQRSGYQIGTPVSYMGNTLVTSADGNEVYVFSSTGQHLQTLKPLTGAPLYLFGYDSSNNLISVTDTNSNVTTIKRNSSGVVTGIVSPYAQTTAISLDANGFIKQTKDPLGNLSLYTTVNGSMVSRTDPRGNIYSYTYDGSGNLIKDADPVGGYHALLRTNATSGLGWTVAHSTAMGLSSSFQSTLQLPWVESANASFSSQQTNVWSDGLQGTSSRALQNNQITETYAFPDGTSDTQVSGADPIWGLQSPLSVSEALTQGNLTMHTVGNRSTTLGSAGNPFSVATKTETQTVNGRLYTGTFTGSNRTLVNTSPVGRTTTVTLDTQERPASLQLANLTATVLAYTSQGRLASWTQGPRKISYAYNSKGFLASILDPLHQKTSFTYDANGQLLGTTLPDGRVATRTYDPNGNLLTLTPPGESAHTFTYTDVDLLSSYSPPGGVATTWAYDLDRKLTEVVRPGAQKIDYAYDDAGRLITVTTASAIDHYTYSSTTGNMASANRGSEHLSFSYNGPLLTKSTWSGTVAGNVSRAFNTNFWLSSQAVNGGTSVTFHRDNDGLISGAGSMTVKRSASNGMISGTTLGVVTDTRSYNTFGELTGYSASVNGSVVYKYQLTRNANGLITAKTETINGVTNSYSYSYDPAGRLTAATKNGQASSYTYDTNSNRLTGTTSSGTASGAYDSQDRLLTYGTTAYTYTAAGDLSSQKTGTQQTSFTYDALGNLTAATLPNATKIGYVIDARNDRVGRMVNNVYTAGFLYDDDQLVAQLNGSNQLVSQFVYGTLAASPDFMISGTSTYRILSDPLGSPVLVIDAASGTIAEQIIYDEFGNVLADTSPGFQPFGFSGGLYDQDTKLVRLGARDYSPATGRWTAKDPILFTGGDTNLYNYVFNDPVNQYDLLGLCDSCKLKDFDDTVKDASKEAAKDAARKAAEKAAKMGAKNLGEDPSRQTRNIQNGLRNATKNAPLRELKDLEEMDAKRCDDSVNPIWKWIKNLWSGSNNGLEGK
jgi:RHS repeat-associated protein